ncbi:hypothetical protein [Pseudalkalibacillus sp. JSM 102089]|uniref:hypothetical protein n=2 Tax=Bacillales TaxID=1385 RepID=UPI00352664A8
MSKTMWFIIAVGVASILVTVMEAAKLRKKKQLKDLWVYSILLCISFTFLVLNRLHIHIPTPITIVNFILEPLSNVLYGWLQ